MPQVSVHKPQLEWLEEVASTPGTIFTANEQSKEYEKGSNVYAYIIGPVAKPKTTNVADNTLVAKLTTVDNNGNATKPEKLRIEYGLLSDYAGVAQAYSDPPSVSIRDDNIPGDDLAPLDVIGEIYDLLTPSEHRNKSAFNFIFNQLLIKARTTHTPGENAKYLKRSDYKEVVESLLTELSKLN